MMSKVMAISLAIACGQGFPAVSSADDAITILYETYPPLFYAEGGAVIGIEADKIEKIFSRAKIKYRYRKTFFRRMPREMEKNNEPICVANYGSKKFLESGGKIVGVFARGEYSPIALLKENLTLFEDHNFVSQVFLDEKITGVFIKGGGYGDEWNRWIGKGLVNTILISEDDEAVARMIVRGRATYGLLSKDQVQYYQTHMKGAENLIVTTVSDSQYERVTYLICSNAVPEEQIERLKLALPQIVSQ